MVYCLFIFKHLEAFCCWHLALICYCCGLIGCWVASQFSCIRLSLCLNRYLILEKVPWGTEKNVYLYDWVKFLWISVMFIWLIKSISSRKSLFILWLEYLSIGKRGYWSLPLKWGIIHDLSCSNVSLTNLVTLSLRYKC